MPNEPYLSGTFDDNETYIEFPDEGITINATVTEVGERVYRLDTIPFLVESAAFADVIEADVLQDGTLRFCRVAQPSNWHMYSFLLPKLSIESAKMTALLDHVMAFGVYWERAFGGFLCICLSPTVDWDPTPEVVEYDW